MTSLKVLAPPEVRDREIWSGVVLRSLESAFSTAGGVSRLYNVLRSPHRYASAAEAVKAALTDGADAIAVINVDEYPGWAQQVSSAPGVHDLPCLYLSSHPLPPPLPHMFYDQNHAGYLAARHAIQCGYRRLLFLGPVGVDWADQRLAGLAQAVRQAGLPASAVMSLATGRPAGKGPEEGDLKQALADWQRQVRPARQRGAWCIVAGNDPIALGAKALLEQAGLAIGPDVGLVGFDDVPASSAQGLTSLRPPLESFGLTAGRMLARALHGEALPLQTRLCSQLIARSSTVRLASPRRRSRRTNAVLPR